MELKFFPRDVIGKRQPKKVGDTFSARLLGGTAKFRVTEFGSAHFMAEMV